MPNEPTETVIASSHLLAKLPNFRVDIPWRLELTPYKVFLAEFLLVRTRADVVVNRFDDIYRSFPDIHSLANSSQTVVEDALASLGLRKRVPYLIKAANYILDKHGGVIPSNPDELMKVPGLGSYTAVAIAAFAYGHKGVPADVNIFRFLSRLTGLEMTHETKGSPELRALLPFLSVEAGGPAPEKLLDFTRLICKPRKPDCPNCPVNKICKFGSERIFIVRA